MKTVACPTLATLRHRHDELLERVHGERADGRGDPVAVSPGLSEELAHFTGQLHDLGTRLYDDTDRSAALSLMCYWNNALYRAEYYQRQGVEPPLPVLAPFAPGEQEPLTDEDYPWPRSERELDASKVSPLWRRLSLAGVEILKARGIVGVIGAPGCGRSHLIDTGLLPEFRRAAGQEFEQHLISPADGLGDEPRTRGAEAEQDLTLLTSLVAIANRLAAADAPRLTLSGLAQDPAALARALDASGRRHLLAVHDLHQIFVLSDDPFELDPSPGQQAFIAALAHVAESPCGHLLVLDVQTEYLPRLKPFSELLHLLDRRTGESASDGWLFVSLENDELRTYITEPAERVGLNFECGLVDRLILEHQSEAAAATILRFALRRLWVDMLAYQDCEKERRNMITWRNYERVGSGRLVLEIAADEATKRVLDAEGNPSAESAILDAIRRVFLELVTIIPGSGCWLPQVPAPAIEEVLQEAGHPLDRTRRIIAEFVRVGLFVETKGPDRIVKLRIFHDALVGRWTRLIQWLETARNAKRLRWMLHADSRDWSRLLTPGPTAPPEGWWAHRREALGRLYRRWSLLWRGAKLREAPDFRHLSERERRFLRHSRWVWRSTVIGAALAIASVPLSVIGVFVARELQQRKERTVAFMNRGVGVIARGDSGLEGGLWLTASLAETEQAPERKFLEWIAPRWKPPSLKASELAQKASIGMAFRRLPTLHNLTTAPEGIISAEISPSGQVALLGCRRQGKIAGRVLLWDLAGATTELVGEKDNVSIERVTFVRDGKGDTLAAAGGYRGDGAGGVVFLWNLQHRPLPPAVRIDTGVRVRGLAFQPAPEGTERHVLAVASGDETGARGRGRVEVIGISSTADGIAVDEAVVLPKVGPEKTEGAAGRVGGEVIGNSSSTADGIAVGPAVPLPEVGSEKAGRGECLPAMHLAFSPQGVLAVAYLDPAAGSGRVALFEKLTADAPPNVLPGNFAAVSDLTFSTHSRPILAVATSKLDFSEGAVRIFRSGKGAWKETLPALQLRSGILRAAFDPTGKSLAATAASGAIGIWNLDAKGFGKPHEIKEGGWPFSLAWSPDGRWIATGNRDRHARVWDVATRGLVLPPLYHGGTVASIGFTPNGLRLLAATTQVARLWDTAPDAFPLLPVRSTDRGYRTLLSQDGHVIAVASKLSGQSRDGNEETELTIWRDGALVPERRISRLPNLARLAMTDDGSMIAALAEKKQGDLQEVWVWKMAHGAPDPQRVPVADGANFLMIVPGEKPRLFVAGSSLQGEKNSPDANDAADQVGFLQILDLEPQQPARKPTSLDFRVKSCAATADGKLLVIGGDGGVGPVGGKLATLDLTAPTLRLKPALHQHDETVTTLALSTKDRKTHLLSGSNDDTVKLFALGSDGELRLLDDQKTTSEAEGTREAGSPAQRHTADVTSVSFSHDGRRAVSTGRDSAAILYDVSGGRLHALVTMDHRAAISHAAFSPDGEWLATGGEETVGLWFVGSGDPDWRGKRVAALPHRYSVTGTAFTPSGELRTLALERGPDTAGTTALVEAYAWTIRPESAPFEQVKNKAELLAGRILVGAPPAPVMMSAPELAEHWAKLPKTAKDRARQHRNQALAAATAGDWKPARAQLLAQREADPEAFQQDPDTLKFAAEVFESAVDPENVRATTEALLPKIRSDAERLFFLEKRAVACLQLARDPAKIDRKTLLEKAEADFQELAKNSTPPPGMRPGSEAQPSTPGTSAPGTSASTTEGSQGSTPPTDKWSWKIRLAEIEVLRGEWDRAIELLKESKRLFDADPRRANEFGRDASTGSQDQRIAAILLVQAAEARAKGDAAVAERAEQAWLALVRTALAGHGNEKATGKARVAWPAVLGAAGEVQGYQTALEFAEEGCKDGPHSFARQNTLAMAFLRNRRLAEADDRLSLAVELYEAERQRTERKSFDSNRVFPGRPQDWILRALLLLARAEALKVEPGEMQTIEAAKKKLHAEAAEYLAEARNELNRPPPDLLSQWRATWNNLDLRVLIDEAQRKLHPPVPGP